MLYLSTILCANVEELYCSVYWYIDDGRLIFCFCVGRHSCCYTFELHGGYGLVTVR